MDNPLKQIMQAPLPPLKEQKKRSFRPTLQDIFEAYDLLNKYIFNNELQRPLIEIKQLKKVFGWCIATCESKKEKHGVILKVVNRYHCKQWMVMILAHEMCHQYQWDVDGPKRIAEKKKPLCSHGPSFYKFREKLKEFGIPLKLKYNSHLWLATQTSL